MNYLAHCKLATLNEQLLVGNFIADHVKGPRLDEYPSGIANGVRMHRMIDREFDKHPQILSLKKQFPQGLRRYSGIVIDCWFDHLLALQWMDHSEIPLTQMQKITESYLTKNQKWLPATQASFIEYFSRVKLFLRYQNRNSTLENIKMISKRLRKPSALLGTIEFFTHKSLGTDQIFLPVFQDMCKLSEQFINDQA